MIRHFHSSSCAAWLLSAAVVFSVFSCSPFFGVPDSSLRPGQGQKDLTERYTDTVPPELVIPGGGVLDIPAPSGDVRYLNTIRSAEESDIMLDPTVSGYQAVRRYLQVSGSAVPDDSGDPDRAYHSVLFRIRKTSGSPETQEEYTYTFRVNSDNRFSGYLYFPSSGIWSVSAFRYPDSYLYPGTSRGTFFSVAEGSATLRFTVEATVGIPGSLHHLIPSRDVDSGNLYLRRYAAAVAEGAVTELEKAQAVFEFLCRGDENGSFYYAYYEEIAPGYLDGEYTDVIIASEFLEKRSGVCNDYAELYAALLRALGLDVYRVTGFKEIDGKRVGHQWNVVVIDGVFYRLDATWASQAWYRSGNMTKARTLAEFYPGFDASRFEAEHEAAFSTNLSTTR